MAATQIKISLGDISDPDDIDDEYLEDILVQDLEGTGNVVDIQRESPDMAIVTLKSPEVAKALIAKREISFGDGTLLIRKPDLVLSKDVLLQNLPTDFKESKLKLSLRGLGLQGKVKGLRQLRDKGVVVSFENMQDAAKLAQRKTLKVGTSDLTTRLYMEEKEEPIVYITGVENLDEDCIEDVLEEIFKRRVNVKEISLLPKENAAKVTFENLADSKMLLDLKSCKLETYRLTLEFFAKPQAAASAKPSRAESKKEHTDKTTVLMKNLSQDVTDDDILLYFESKRGHNSQVEEVHYNEDKNTAVVTFRESSDAQKLVKQGVVDMHGVNVKLELYEPKVDRTMSIGERNTVTVSGLPTRTTDEDIQMYFENRRQKGGPVEYVKHDPSSSTAVVCFEKSEDAQRMVDNVTMQFLGTIITIKWHKSTPADSSEDEDDQRMVLASDLPDNINEDYIFMYFENPRLEGGPVENVKYNAQEDCAIVTFENSSDAVRIVSKVEMKMKNSTISVQWYKSKGKDTEDKKSVFVSGLPMSGVHQDFIQMYFESPRQNGGNVEKVEYDQEACTAVVTFEESSVAQSFVEKKQLKMKKSMVMVEWHKRKPKGHMTGREKGTSPEGDISLEVTNIPKNCQEGFVRLYFESIEKKDDGSKITEMSYNPVEGRAIIKFSKPDVALKVLEVHKKEPLSLQDTTLTVKVIDSKSLGKHAFSANSCALQITDLPKCEDEGLLREALELVFENPATTGGEEIEDLFISRDMSRAVVTYAKPKVAVFVMSKHNEAHLCVDDQEVQIEVMPALSADLKSTEKVEEEILCLLNLPDCITSQDIRDYLELCCDYNVTDIIYSQNIGDALVNFNQPPDFGRIFEHFCMKPLKGSMVTPMRVVQSSTLEVYGVCKPKDIGKVKVKLHFENRRAKGGKVSDVTIDKEMDCAIVTFENVEDARNVLKVPNHTIQNQNIQVKLHHKCIGLLPDWFDCKHPVMHGPKEVHVPCGGKHVVNFLFHAHTKKKKLDKDLKGMSAEVDWPSSVKQDKVLVRCTLDEDRPDYQTVATNWESDVTACINGHFTGLVEQVAPVPREVSEDVKSYLQKNYSSKGDEVKVQVLTQESPKEPTVVVAGIKEIVMAAIESIKKEVGNMKRRHENKQNLKSLEVTNLSTLQLRYLARIDFDKSVEEKYDDCSVNIDTESNKLTFHGTDQDNVKAKREMVELVQNLHQQRCPLPAEIMGMYRKEAVAEFALKVLRDAEMQCVVFSVGPENLDIVSDNQGDLEKAIQALSQCVCDQSLPVGEDATVTVKSRLWKEMQEELQQSHGTKLNLMECPSAIRIIATSDIADTVYNDIEDFFKTNTVNPEFIPTDKNVAKLIDRASELPQINEKFPGSSIKLSAELGGNPGIVVKADSEIREMVVKEAKTLITAVVHEMYIIDQPGMPDYFKNEKSGHSALKNIERDNNVVIELQGETTTSTEDEEISSTPTTRTQIVLLDVDDVNLELVYDDILMQNCDAVMVPVNKEMAPLKGPGKRVLDRAGEVVRREVVNKKHRAVRQGYCFATKAGSLNYKHVVFSVFPVNKEEQEPITAALTEIWKLTDAKRMESIALPGNIFDKYPSHVAANALKLTLSKSSHMREVSVVAEDKSIVVTLRRIATILSPDYSKTEDYMGFATPVVYKAALYKAGDDDGTVCTKEGIKVTLVRGEIAKQEVDVIVNTANIDFQLNVGAVSASILKEGGRHIQSECDKIIRGSDFRCDRIVETSGGNLKCKKIYHITLAKWGTGNDSIKQALSSQVTGCLDKAQKSRLRTIAFPAVGTGNLGYPKEYVAKLMYENIYKFSKNNPRSCLKRVKLVVYYMDEPIIQKYEDISREVCSPGYYGLPTDEKGTRGGARSGETKKDKGKRHTCIMPADYTLTKKAKKETLDTHDIQVGKLQIQLEKGDITMEQTDVIVNSTDSNLSLESQLSKAIVRAGGSRIKKECESKGRIKDVALTSAGNLECNHVIHIAAPDNDTEWKQRINATLELAHNRRLDSISFPALGTGAMAISPAMMCDVFMDAIATFVESYKMSHINLIRFVIFDEEMFDVFKTEMKKIVDSARGRSFSMVPKESKKKGHRSKKLAGARQVLPPKQDVSASESDEESHHVIDTMVPIILKTLTVKVTAFNKDDAHRALDEIGRICDDECGETEIPISDTDILSDVQNEAIQNLEKLHAVSIAIDRDAPCVRVKGRGKEAGVVYKKVTDMLREAENGMAIEKEQENMYEIVRWQFYNADIQDYEDYPVDINYKIEMAQKAQYDIVEWTEENDETFKLDFRNMQEYPAGNRSEAVNVRKYSPAETDLPSTWKKMRPQENVGVFELPTSKREGEKVFQMIQHSMSQTNYLKRVISIERIQNKRLYRNYMINKTTVQMANPSIKLFERTLWHGTTIDAVDGINSSGFNRAHSFSDKSVTHYGKGVYFASEAEEAHHYTFGKDKHPPKDGIHIMYLCDVLTGAFTKGEPGILEPPVKDEVTKKKYDSVVDDEDDPHIFVVFYDALAYPKYLIRYESINAKPKFRGLRDPAPPPPSDSDEEDSDRHVEGGKDVYETYDGGSYIEG